MAHIHEETKAPGGHYVYTSVGNNDSQMEASLLMYLPSSGPYSGGWPLSMSAMLIPGALYRDDTDGTYHVAVG